VTEAEEKRALNNIDQHFLKTRRDLQAELKEAYEEKERAVFDGATVAEITERDEKIASVEKKLESSKKDYQDDIQQVKQDFSNTRNARRQATHQRILDSGAAALPKSRLQRWLRRK
jgi:hypothetical protein